MFALAVYSPHTIVNGEDTISENTKIEIVHTPLPPVPLPGASADADEDPGQPTVAPIRSIIVG